MSSSLRALQLHQVDQMLTRWRQADLPPAPRPGWVRTIRDALGMPGRALAARLGISVPGLHKLESSEAEHQINLATLEKMAEALDCELRYALVPRRPLHDQLQDRAVDVARAKLEPVAHTMSLEDQRVDARSAQLQLDLMVKSLLDGPRNKLW
jgi:predicted DNA-binding mobile mystery protein A